MIRRVSSTSLRDEHRRRYDERIRRATDDARAVRDVRSVDTLSESSSEVRRNAKVDVEEDWRAIRLRKGVIDQENGETE